MSIEILKIKHIVDKIINNNYVNRICLSIDPGVNIGISLFILSNITQSNKLSYQLVYSIQKKFIKTSEPKMRMQKIYLFIEEIILKYGVDLIVMEDASYSIGKYSYAENILSKYTGVIESIVSLHNLQMIYLNYGIMQKLIIGYRTKLKNKECARTIINNAQIFNLYIKKTHIDQVDAICYGYAIFICISYYYNYIKT